MKGIKIGSKEIQAIFRDAQSIHSTIRSLHAVLRKGKMRAETVDDDRVLEMARGSRDLLSNCEMVLGELVFKLQK